MVSPLALLSFIFPDTMIKVKVSVAPELVGQVVGVARLEPADLGVQQPAGQLLHHSACG